MWDKMSVPSESPTDPVELIKISQMDFEASKVLFERGLYQQALFMLQQSLEKSAKAICLKLCIVKSKEELKKEIGHSIVKKISRLIADEIPEMFEQVLRYIEPILTNLKNSIGVNFADELNKIIQDIKQMIEETFEEFQKKAKEFYGAIDEVTKKAFEKVDGRGKKKIDELIDRVAFQMYSSLLPLTEGLEEIIIQYLKIAEKYGISPSLRKDSILSIIYLATTLGIIMYWHTPFEGNVENLRCQLLNLNNDVILVWWSQDIIMQIEKIDMLRCLEEFTTGEIKSPRFRKILDSLKEYIYRLKESHQRT